MSQDKSVFWTMYVIYMVITLSVVFTLAALRIDNEISGDIWAGSFSTLETVLVYTAFGLAFIGVPLTIQAIHKME